MRGKAVNGAIRRIGRDQFMPAASGSPPSGSAYPVSQPSERVLPRGLPPCPAPAAGSGAERSSSAVRERGTMGSFLSGMAPPTRKVCSWFVCSVYVLERGGRKSKTHPRSNSYLCQSLSSCFSEKIGQLLCDLELFEERIAWPLHRSLRRIGEGDRSNGLRFLRKDKLVLSRFAVRLQIRCTGPSCVITETGCV